MSQQQEVTPLTPQEESAFQQWVRDNGITDVDHPDSHYDYRGYWKETGSRPIQFGVDHFPDTFKQHGHPTFSIESKYSKGPNDGGHWVGETFVPAIGYDAIAQKLQPGNEYDAIIKAQIDRDAAPLRQSLAEASGKSADRAAEIQELSRKTLLPPDIVERNFDEIKKRATVQDNDYERLLRDTPDLAAWLKDPWNAAVAHDDVSHLGAIDQLLHYGANGLMALGAAIPATNAAIWGILQAPADLFSEWILQPTGFFEPGEDPMAKLAQRFAQYRHEQEGVEKAWAPQAPGFVESQIYQGMTSLGQNLLLWSMAPAGETAVLAGMAGTVLGQSYGQARDQNVPALRALTFATAQSAIEFWTERIPAHTLFESLGPNKIGFFKLLAKETYQEMQGEQIASALQDLDEWAVLPENQTKTIWDYLASRPASIAGTAIGVLVGTLGQVGAVRLIDRHLLPALNRLAGDSKTGQRSLDKLNDFLARSSADTLLENVFLPAEDIKTYAQEQKVDPGEWLEKVTPGGRDAYQQAIERGTDVQVPLAHYVTRVGMTDAGRYFDDVVRWDPERKNAREMEELAKASIPDEKDQPVAPADPFLEGRRRIYDDLTGMMQGYFRPETTHIYAAFEADLVANMAKSAGLDPWVAYSEKGLRISRPMPGVLQAMPNRDARLETMLERIRKGSLPTLREMYGPSLTEFLKEKGGVKDEGGDLASREPDKDKDKRFKLGRKIMPLINNETGMPLDTAREKAVEEGYLPAGSDINALLDRLDDEMRDQHVFAIGKENQAAIDEHEALQQLEEYLKQRDVDVQTVTLDQVKALLQEAAPENGDRYEQWQHAEQLAADIDQAYESGQLEGIEDKETQLENLLDALDHAGAESEEEGDQVHREGDGVSIDEQLAADYRLLEKPTAGMSREDVLANMRAVLDEAQRGGQTPAGLRADIGDDELIAAAKDAHDRQRELRSKEHAGGKKELDRVREFLKARGVDTSYFQSANKPAYKPGQHPQRVSERRTLGVNADPDNHTLRVGLAEMKRRPVMLRDNMRLVREYLNYRSDSGARTPEQQAERFIEHVKDNLLFLWNEIPKEFQKASRVWYEGAHRLTLHFAQKFNLPEQAAAGVMAVLSPQKPWPVNVSLAERVMDTWTNRQHFLWTEEMSEKAEELFGGKKDAIIRNAEARTLAEVESLSAKALWIRVYDETYNSRRHREVKPDGDLGDFRGGTPWQTLPFIMKAVAILQNPERENISRWLGENHKIRNFYLNILDPSDRSALTIDTHAVAAGLLRLLAGKLRDRKTGVVIKDEKGHPIKTPEIAHNFGDGAASSDPAGLSGTYGLYAEAYRRGAMELKILPRELQSVTWDWIRLIKEQSDADTFTKVEDVWRRYKKGQLSEKQARRQFARLTPKPSPLERGSARRGDGPTWDSTYGEELSEARLHRGGPTGSGGTGSGAAGGNPPLSTRGRRGGGGLTFYQSAPGTPWYYSALTRAGEIIEQTAGSPERMLNLLKKQPGVTAAEIAWSGVEEFLKSRNGKVTKQELVDYLKANEIRLEERVFEDAEGEFRVVVDGDRDNVYYFDRITDAQHWVSQQAQFVVEQMASDARSDREEFTTADEDFHMSEERDRYSIEETRYDGNSPQWAEYKRTGGKHYREMLLKLPAEDSPQAKTKIEELKAEASRIHARMQELNPPSVVMPKANLPAEYWELRYQLNEIGEQLAELNDPKRDYAGGHWKDKNVVVHIRFDERRDASGNPVLVIHEIQSDWNQQGTHDGYRGEASVAGYTAERETHSEAYIQQYGDGLTWTIKDPSGMIVATEVEAPTAEAALRRQQRYLESGTRWTVVDQNGNQRGDFATQQAARHYLENAPDFIDRTRSQIREVPGGQAAVPDNPFRDNWQQLAFRRMVRWAAENGFDRVAWTTGEEQIDTNQDYLRQNVDTITWSPVGSELDVDIGALRKRKRQALLTGTPEEVAEIDRLLHEAGQAGQVVIEASKDGNSVFRQQVKVDGTTILRDGHGRTRPATLEALVGKKMADEIRAGLADPNNDGGAFEGDGLAIGGAFHKMLYDEDLVGYAKKFGKKFGATVSKSPLKPDHYYEVVQVKPGPYTTVDNLGTEHRWRVVQHDRPDFSDTGTFATGPIRTKEEAEDWIRNKFDMPMHTLEITEKMRDTALHVGFPFYQGARGDRGRITFGRDPKTGKPLTSLELLSNADLSTFIHEISHFNLELFGDLVDVVERQGAEGRTSEQARLVDDYRKLLGWLGVENRAQIGREQHEQFARGMELYVAEGRAPSPELRGAFARMKAWMLRAYRNLADLNVTLTDEVRGVFDRMIASKEQIAQAKKDAKIEALIASDEMRVKLGMSEQEWTLYKDRVLAASQAAADRLERQYFDDYNRYQTEWYKARRQEVHDEVAEEVHSQRGYMLLSFLKDGTLPDGSELPNGFVGMKLDGKVLKKRYGKAVLRTLRRLNTYRLEGGVDPDHVAEIFQYTSGDEMINALLNLRPMHELIEAETDDRMRAEFKDIKTDGTAAEQARDAVLTEGQSEIVEEEIRALKRAQREAQPAINLGRAQERQADRERRDAGLRDLNKYTPTVELARSIAEKRIGAKQVRELQPGLYFTAARRESERAIEAAAKNNFDVALEAKQKQLINLEMYRAARAAQEEAEKIRDYMRTFEDKKTRQRIGKVPGDYLEQIDGLLERFDFSRQTNKALAKRKSLAEWVQSQQDAGMPVTLPAELLEETYSKNYREMTMDELRSLRDGVAMVEHYARLKQELLTAKDKRDFDAIKAEIVSSIEQNAPKKGGGGGGGGNGTFHLRTRENAGGKLPLWARGFAASHRKMSSLAFELDGLEMGGSFWHFFIRPMNEAGDRKAQMRADATARLTHLLKPLKGLEMGGKGQYFPSLGASFNRQERIAMVLNMGNASNMQRLLGGEDWTPAQVRPILDSLSKAEMDFVQGIWDHFESYRPAVKDLERRTVGLEPVWIEPTPVVTQHGTYRGGYYPVKFDPARSKRTEQQQAAADVQDLLKGVYTSATTRQSYTKTRVEVVYDRPLQYTFAGIYQGTEEVIHDLAWREWLIDANRLLNSESIDKAIRTRYGPEGVKVFSSGVMDIARGESAALTPLEKAINHFRIGGSIAMLGFNATSALKQLPGLTVAANRIGKGWVARAVLGYIGAPQETGRFIEQHSDMMRLRAQTMQRELSEIRNTVSGKTEARQAVEGSFFALTTAFQSIVDRIAWMGEYNRAMAEGETEERAFAMADQAVLDTQGGGQIQDLAQIQRGSPALKLFTMFYHGYAAQYQVTVERAKQAGVAWRNSDSAGEKAGAALSLAVDYLLMYGTQAALAVAIAKLFRGDDEDWATGLLREGLSGLLGLMVGLRELEGSAEKLLGLEKYHQNYSGPAGLRIVAELEDAADELHKGHWGRALRKSAISAGGIIAHFPAAQINRSIDGITALMEGRTSNPAAILFGAPPQ